MKPFLRVHALRLRNSWKFMLGVAVLATASAVLCQKYDLLRMSDAELGAYDQGLTFFTGGHPRSREVVIVGIDDKTLQGIRDNEQYVRNYGVYPYSRNLWARVFEHLVDEGARAIVFDGVMDERGTDESNDLALAQVLEERGIPLTLGFSINAGQPALPRVEPVNRVPQRPLPAPVADVRPASAEGEELTEVVPAGGATGDEFVETEGPPPLTPEEVARALAFPVHHPGLSLPTLEQRSDDAGARLMRHPVHPLPGLVRTAPGFGLVLQEQDEDGRLRRTRFAYSDGTNTYATLSLAAAADILGAERVELAPGRLKIGPRELRINPDGSAELDFGGTWKERFEALSVYAVLEDWARRKEHQTKGTPYAPVIPAGTFRDKVVLVGGLSVGTADVKATPFQSDAPGLVKHAVMLETLLSGGFITEAPFWVSLLLTFGVALFSVSLITLVRAPLLEIAWPLLLFFGLFLVTGVFLEHGRVHVLSAMPIYAGEFASLSAVAFNHMFANRERERLRLAFNRFLDKTLVDQLVEQQKLPSLEGETRDITAFFSDIRGFSSFSERFKDDPKALGALLNRYLTRVSSVLMAHGACLDKYIGDAVVCLFGAPLDMPDHAVRACHAALAVRAEVDALRAELQKEGLPDVYTRIGLNSAEMFVGNFGSEHLLDYTAIGDGMNLASRLEGANKAYGSVIMIGPRTYEMAREHIEARELDRVKVAGKEEAVTVYELLARAGELPAAKRATVERYHQALALYRGARFEEAAGVLEQALAADAEDGPSRALLARCRRYALNPPPLPFDGVVSLEK
ncbi:adenylate/guanylate cyclase domain-containing protein [Vitiosangium sp. GDMCC 1.1324]|uniref:adenylate/guanylate cyclase domain-containing protein n=1 Tax=Vitiosangium sp. (strain GDMCC 1.1324) TaxID=2138576 RepID=UPI000D366BD7|nr:adenylate/guanylate cyclase domain-containing protein [Vitiosangium sp. GDMCC 1.1324]PTL83624.1 adenylate/guanylate cyclase domain-containing protein [Vitiosangium sp. GDMCC 1.1324]